MYLIRQYINAFKLGSQRKLIRLPMGNYKWWKSFDTKEEFEEAKLKLMFKGYDFVHSYHKMSKTYEIYFRVK